MNERIRTLTFCILTASLGVLATPDAHAASPLSSSAAQVHGLLAATTTALKGKLNVNDATQAQWELLPGIGPATAKKLVDYRTKKPFGDLTHVMRIKGIGRKTYNQIKPYLSLKGETTLARSKSSK